MLRRPLFLPALALTALVAAGTLAQSPAEPLSLHQTQRQMQSIAQLLKNSQTGEPTQQQQKQVVDVLTSLIELTEQRERQNQSSAAAGAASQPQPGATNPSQNPGSQSGQTGGNSQGVDSPAAAPQVRTGPQSPWSTLRDKQRDPVFNAIQDKFPARYQQLIEQYYKSFQDAPPR